MKIIVLGGGIAGIASACRLARAGHDVTILEKNNNLGGKMSSVEKDGFRWDGGPSFFTDPGEFESLFSDCGKNVDDYFKWIELDEACRYFYGDEIVYGYDEPEKLASELLRAFNEPKVNTLQFLSDVRVLYDAAGLQFLNNPVGKTSILQFKTFKSIRSLPRGSLYSSLHSMHKEYFDSPRSVQFFDRFATYVGASPLKCPGMLMAMPHLEHNLGAVQPVSGMKAITSAAHKLAEDLGVTIKLDQEVRSINKIGDKWQVATDTSKLECDILVNAGEIANFYKMTDEKTYKKHTAREHSLSAYVLYLGVRDQTDSLYLHNILFSDDYNAETAALWAGKVYDDPTIYINCTSKLESQDAPKGNENWFVMVNVPAGFNESSLPELRKNVMKKLERHFPGIEGRIVTEARSLTPSFISKTYNSHEGAIYGVAANSIRGAFLRPHNKDKKHDNLYHVGVTVHPGGGIPLALRSAKIVAEMIG